MLLESAYLATVTTDGDIHGKNDKWFVHKRWFVHVALNQLFQFRPLFSSDSGAEAFKCN